MTPELVALIIIPETWDSLTKGVRGDLSEASTVRQLEWRDGIGDGLPLGLMVLGRRNSSSQTPEMAANPNYQGSREN